MLHQEDHLLCQREGLHAAGGKCPGHPSLSTLTRGPRQGRGDASPGHRPVSGSRCVSRFLPDWKPVPVTSSRASVNPGPVAPLTYTCGGGGSRRGSLQSDTSETAAGPPHWPATRSAGPVQGALEKTAHVEPRLGKGWLCGTLWGRITRMS